MNVWIMAGALHVFDKTDTGVRAIYGCRHRAGQNLPSLGKKSCDISPAAHVGRWFYPLFTLSSLTCRAGLTHLLFDPWCPFLFSTIPKGVPTFRPGSALQTLSQFSPWLFQGTIQLQSQVCLQIFHTHPSASSLCT